MSCLELLLISASCHPPQFEVDGPFISRWRWLSEWGKPHLYHACLELSCVIKLEADIFSYLSGGLGKGVLPGQHVINRVLDFTALPFELGFSIPTATVPVVSALVASGGGVAVVAGSVGRRTCSAGIARHWKRKFCCPQMLKQLCVSHAYVSIRQHYGRREKAIMQSQTFFVNFSLRTTMRGFFLSLLSFTFYRLLLADARHQLRQSSSCGYLVPHRHSSLLSQQDAYSPF